MTPLPGSRDHHAAVEAGTPLDPDFNNFDSFRPAMPHPLMSAEEWMRTYWDAWTNFYTFDHMRRALLRQNPHTYWGMFKCFLWYRASMIEGTHPMVTGFFRLKDRLNRRPGRPIEGRWQFFKRRLRETAHISLDYAKLLLEMQELWIATRIRHEEYGFVGDLRALKTRAAAMLEVKAGWARAHAAGSKLSEWRVPSLPPLRPRAAAGRLLARLNVVKAPTLEARRKLSAYWRQTEARLRGWQLWRVNPVSLAWNGARDVKNLLIFVAAMTQERY
jgi:hypothetical protein